MQKNIRKHQNPINTVDTVSKSISIINIFLSRYFCETYVTWLSFWWWWHLACITRCIICTRNVFFNELAQFHPNFARICCPKIPNRKMFNDVYTFAPVSSDVIVPNTSSIHIQINGNANAVVHLKMTNATNSKRDLNHFQ